MLKYFVPKRNGCCTSACPHTTFLSLAFLFNAFAVTDLTPTKLYSLKIPAGQGQLLIPWRESIKDTYLFRKLLRTPLGAEISDDHLSYDFLRTQLRKVGELTGFAFPVGAYCFRRGNGEALDNSSDISEAQRNLFLQHARNSTVFIQKELMRVATGMSRTIDKRRPRLLSPSQVEQAWFHPKVQALLRLRESYKRRLKSGAATIERHKGTRLYEQYCKIKRAYISEFEFRKKTLLGEVKKKFHEEQPVVDILHQIHGSDLQDAKGDVADLSSLSAEQTRVINALVTITPPELSEERSLLDEFKTVISFQSALVRLPSGAWKRRPHLRMRASRPNAFFALEIPMRHRRKGGRNSTVKET